MSSDWTEQSRGDTQRLSPTQVHSHCALPHAGSVPASFVLIHTPGGDCSQLSLPRPGVDTHVLSGPVSLARMRWTACEWAWGCRGSRTEQVSSKLRLIGGEMVHPESRGEAHWEKRAPCTMGECTELRMESSHCRSSDVSPL